MNFIKKYFFLSFSLLIILSINTNIYPQKNITFTKEKGIEYAVILPIDYDPQKKYYLAMGLHGLDGDWQTFTKTFAKYSKYQNIIFISVVGNRYHYRFKKQWGYRYSLKYLLKAFNLFNKKYKLHKERLIFGYSQGAHQSIHFYLKYPRIFSHLVAFSGGYQHSITKLLQRAFFKNIYYIVGNGDVDRTLIEPIKKTMQKLKKKHAFVQYTILKDVPHRYAYTHSTWKVFNWFLRNLNNNRNDKKFITGDYLKAYRKSIKHFRNRNYQKAYINIKRSLRYNPYFARGYLHLSKISLRLKKKRQFKISFFKSLKLYSQYKGLNNKDILNIFKNIPLSIRKQNISRKEILNYLLKITKYKSQFLPLFNAQIYYSLAKYSIQSKRNKDKIKQYIKEAKYYMKKVTKKNEKSLSYFSNYIMQLNNIY